MLKKLWEGLWRIDGLPLPNDGVCYWCHYDHGPRFGQFVCEKCGGFCADNDLAKNIDMMPKKKFYGAILGGFFLGGAVVVIGLAVDALVSILLDR